MKINIKSVNNDPKVLENTNGYSIMVVHENSNRVHEVLRIKYHKMMK